jgi:transcriptional regulator with XRE-family HTH domain
VVEDVAKDKDTTGFGQRLRELREARGLSQDALGKLCQPSMRYQAIARLERSEQSPTWPTVLKLATALGVEPNDFLDDDQPTKKKPKK